MIDKMNNEFLIKYKNFKNFKEGTYKPFWDLCITSLSNQEFYSYMILCNDLNNIPPVKSFLLYYEQEIIDLTGNPNGILDVYCKKGIGAFYGMLFRFILGYTTRKSVKVTMKKKFDVSTAYIFTK